MESGKPQEKKIVEIMHANMDKRGVAKMLVQGGIPSTPGERKHIKECSNYRTISLVVHASKSLLKIIKGRIKLHYEKELENN